jgi:hypothetical protein
MIIGDVISVEKGRYIVKVRSDNNVRVPFGEFVGVRLDGGATAVGVVSGTMNRVKDELLPYMDSQKLPKYLPYVEDYSENHLIVTPLGWLDGKGATQQLAYAPVSLKSTVETLKDEETRAFHHVNGCYRASYLYRLRLELDQQTVILMVERLGKVLPPEVGPELRAIKRLYEGGGLE